ncbi:MAG TPA: class I SAM-dependent methyltransferase [Pyrinomonadaceae bacterium]|nr:class I SAM-dependent methyltransferase [Pyrinomonadaceae bacterium]
MRKAMLPRLHILGVAVLAIIVAACAAAQNAEVRQAAQQQATPTATPTPKEVKKDVPYVPTPQNVVDEMLTLANVKKDDVVYDLGCGDGRLVITAVKKFGAKRGFGVDIDPQRIEESNANAKAAGVTDRVQFAVQDLFQTDLKEASVVTLYLLPAVNLRLRPKLLSELRPGTRVVSHSFDMGDWKPDKTVTVQPGGQILYFWTIPAKAAQATPTATP